VLRATQRTPSRRRAPRSPTTLEGARSSRQHRRGLGTSCRSVRNDAVPRRGHAARRGAVLSETERGRPATCLLPLQQERDGQRSKIGASVWGQSSNSDVSWQSVAVNRYLVQSSTWTSVNETHALRVRDAGYGGKMHCYSARPDSTTNNPELKLTSDHATKRVHFPKNLKKATDPEKY
jgi:hypothetical protein